MAFHRVISKMLLAIFAVGTLWAVPSGATSTEGRDEEVGLGYFEDQQMVASQFLVLGEEVNRQVTAIGDRLASVGGRGDLRYTFRIVNNPIVNAYATSGGFIYVNSGLLDVLGNSDELAAVLAHELVHTNESHLVNSLHSAY